MTWGEVDFQASDGSEAPGAKRANPKAIWYVPASWMKAGREHRVPLTAEAVAILRDMAGIPANGSKTGQAAP